MELAKVGKSFHKLKETRTGTPDARGHNRRLETGRIDVVISLWTGGLLHGGVWLRSGVHGVRAELLLDSQQLLVVSVMSLVNMGNVDRTSLYLASRSDRHGAPVLIWSLSARRWDLVGRARIPVRNRVRPRGRR